MFFMSSLDAIAKSPGSFIAIAASCNILITNLVSSDGCNSKSVPLPL
jgi:hypothetical protein